MKRSISSLLFAVLLPLGAAVGILSTSTDASAQYYGRRYWAPSPTYVARYRPVYYNGYAHYYYGGHWGYYQPGYGWRYYERTPQWFCTYRDELYGWHGC